MQPGKENEKVDGNWYVLLAGLPVLDNPITLAPGLSLRPLKSDLTIFDLAAAGAAGFRGWAALEPFCSTCTAEIESAKDAAILPGYDTLNRAWLATALLVLRGFTRLWGVACSGYPWDSIAGHQVRTKHIFNKQLLEEGPDKAVHQSKRELPPFRGNLLDYHLTCFVDRDSRNNQVTSDDAEWLQRYFQAFNQLASESESFRFGLEAAIDWRFAKDPRSAVARLWAGIEALFGINAELVFRISLSSACLLSPRGEARQEKFESIKKLYGLRSKIVHGEKLPNEKIFQAMNDSFHLLRDLLLLSVERGHALSQKDVDDAIFC